MQVSHDSAFDPQLQAWAKDEGIVAVFLHSAGEKAFCAGGDVKQICLAGAC
ncbi:MAG: enoyl-CoA hydratase/isomerase family protein [Moraxellaceae bacterium]|nr:enoyl-CoA hydratase/isomerase family protein [Moraxellaceae bacterium]